MVVFSIRAIYHTPYIRTSTVPTASREQTLRVRGNFPLASGSGRCRAIPRRSRSRSPKLFSLRRSSSPSREVARGFAAVPHSGRVVRRKGAGNRQLFLPRQQGQGGRTRQLLEVTLQGEETVADGPRRRGGEDAIGRWST